MCTLELSLLLSIIVLPISPFLGSNFCLYLAARILRAIRIGARLQFRFAKDTALSVKKLTSTILRLDRVLDYCFGMIFFFIYLLFFALTCR